MTSGIYAIINTVTGDEYVGKSENIEVRWRTHIMDLNASNWSHNKRFHEAWQIHGPRAFRLVILEECEVQSTGIDPREAYHISLRKPVYNGVWLPQNKRRNISVALPTTLANRIDDLARARGGLHRSQILEFFMPQIVELLESLVSELETLELKRKEQN